MKSRLILLGTVLCLLGAGCLQPKASQGANPQRLVATIGNEPIYAIEADRLVDEQIKRIKSSDGIFARPSPEELAFMQENALHTLLLNGVYRQPDVSFSKPRAIEYTRALTLERAQAVQADLLAGKSTQEVLDTHIKGVYKEPAQVFVDLVSTGQIQPAYRAEAFTTPVGGITDIIEDPSGGYYILRIIKKEPLPEGATRIQADSFFVQFDKEAGRIKVKEEDLSHSKVVILDPTLLAVTRLREARDAGRDGDAAKEQQLLAEARTTLEGQAKSWATQPRGHFLMAWITELQARDPSSGATYEQALAHYEKAAELQGKASPGDPCYGYYLERTGEMLERIGRQPEALEAYARAFENAKDNFDLTLGLRLHFEALNATELLAKADTELRRMGDVSAYGRVEAGQKVLRVPGRLAEAANGDAEIFNVEGVSQVVE